MRFVLLANFAESGDPPPGLRTSSGMLAVVLPDDSRLTRLFLTGEVNCQRRHDFGAILPSPELERWPSG